MIYDSLPKISISKWLFFSLMLFKMLVLVACGRTEEEAKVEEEDPPPPPLEIEEKIVPYLTQDGSELVFKNGGLFELKSLTADRQGKVNLIGKSRTKKNGFTRFEITGPDPFPENSLLPLGQTFYGRTTEDEAIVSINPLDNKIQLWLVQPNCTSQTVFQATVSNSLKSYQVATGQIDVDQFSFVGRIDSGVFIRLSSLALKKNDSTILETSENYTCKTENFNSSATASQLFLRNVGESFDSVGSQSLVLGAPSTFDLAKTKDEFWGAINFLDRVKHVKVKIENLASTNQIKLEIKDINPLDSSLGNYVSLTKTISLEKKVGKGFFHSLALPSTPDPAEAEAPNTAAESAALLEDGDADSDEVSSNLGDHVQCMIHNNELKTRAQWLVCSGLLIGTSEFDAFDNLYFSLVAVSKMRKKTKEEKKVDQEDAEKRKEEAKKRQQEQIKAQQAQSEQ